MLSLVLSTLRSRLAGFVGAFVALFCAATLVAVCGVLLETGLRGELQPQRYAGAPIIIAGDQLVYEGTEKKDGKVKVKGKPVLERVWIDRDLVSLVAEVPGVESAIAEVSAPARVVVGGNPIAGPDGSPSWAHGWSSAAITPMELRAGAAPEQADEVVLDAELAARAGIAPGDVVTIASTGEPNDYRVVGLAAPAGRDGPAGQSALYFTDTEVDRLADRPGQVAGIGVIPTPEADVAEVASAIDATLTNAAGQGKIVVHTGSARGQVEFLQAEQARVRLISLGGAIGGTSLLVAVLVVVGTFTLQLQHRRRELALLRAIAATPRQIRRMVGIEAAVIGIAAGVPGAVLGLALASSLRDLLVDVGVVPSILEPVTSPFPVFAAIVVTLAAAGIAAQVSARRGTRIAPTEALGEAAVEARVPVLRMLAGAAATAGYIVLLTVLSGLDSEAAATPVTFLSVVLAVVAVALLAPLLTRIAAAIASVPLRLSRFPSGYLAAESLRTRWGRSAAAVTPLCLMVAMACTALSVPATLAAAADDQVTDGTHASHVVTSRGLGVSPDVMESLRDVDGVTAVTAQLRSTVRSGLTQYPIQGLSADSHQVTNDLGILSGSMDALDHATVAVSGRYARNHGVAVGDTIDITLGDRTPASLRVIAVYARGLGFGDLTVTSERLSAHVDNPLPRTVFISTSRESDDLGDRLAAAVAGSPGTDVLGDEGYQAAQDQRDSESTRTNVAIMAPIVALALIAAVNTIAVSISQRSGDFALLRRIGTTRGQVRRALLAEITVIALLATALGTAITFATLTAFGRGMAEGAGAALPLLTVGLVAGSAAGLAILTTAAAARVSLRTHPGSTDG